MKEQHERTDLTREYAESLNEDNTPNYDNVNIDYDALEGRYSGTLSHYITIAETLLEEKSGLYPDKSIKELARYEYATNKCSIFSVTR